jgi:hypothetical protein
MIKRKVTVKSAVLFANHMTNQGQLLKLLEMRKTDKGCNNFCPNLDDKD